MIRLVEQGRLRFHRRLPLHRPGAFRSLHYPAWGGLPVVRSVSRLLAALPCPSAGRSTPSVPVSLVSNDSASGRIDPRLNDPDWLRREYRASGDKAIAKMLGCHPLTVKRRRERFGIAPEGPGRRRGVATSTVRELRPAFALTDETERLILDRLRAEQTKRVSPSEDVLAERIRAAHDARLHGNQLAYEDALIDIASSAGLIHRHQRRLRRAA